MSPAGFDWPALLRASLQALQLQPAEFWSLTPAELSLLLGLEERIIPLRRHEFQALSERHPDTPRRPA